MPAIFRQFESRVTPGQVKINKPEAPILSLSQCKRHFQLLILMLAGDIHINPGTNWKYPCQVCNKPVKHNQCGICGDYCELWSHTRCIGMTNEAHLEYQNNEQLTWSCLGLVFGIFYVYRAYINFTLTLTLILLRICVYNSFFL